MSKKIEVEHINTTPMLNRMRRYKDDAEWHYYPAHASPDRVAELQELGYEVVTQGMVKQKVVTLDKLFKSKELEADDPVRIGASMVLMRCPQEEYQARQAYRNRKAEQRMDAPRRMLQQKGEALGVEVYDQSKTYKGLMQEAVERDRSERDQIDIRDLGR